MSSVTTHHLLHTQNSATSDTEPPFSQSLFSDINPTNIAAGLGTGFQNPPTTSPSSNYRTSTTGPAPSINSRLGGISPSVGNESSNSFGDGTTGPGVPSLDTKPTRGRAMTNEGTEAPPFISTGGPPPPPPPPPPVMQFDDDIGALGEGKKGKKGAFMKYLKKTAGIGGGGGGGMGTAQTISNPSPAGPLSPVTTEPTSTWSGPFTKVRSRSGSASARSMLALENNGRPGTPPPPPPVQSGMAAGAGGGAVVVSVTKTPVRSRQVAALSRTVLELKGVVDRVVEENGRLRDTVEELRRRLEVLERGW